MAVLTATSLFAFWGIYSIDHYWASSQAAGTLSSQEAPLTPFDRYVQFDPASITDAVSSLAGMIAAVFGIVITVVSIIVQLSAARYAGVTRMFFRDRINLAVMAYYIVACVCGVWLSVSLQRAYVPRVALLTMLFATTGGLVLMAPYFGYVFWFLEPMNIIGRIQREASAVEARGARVAETEPLAAAQASVVKGMEELTDIANASISGKDKIIASGAVDALKDFALEYMRRKPMAQPAWFVMGSELRKNPDFVAMDPESLADLESRKTWVEWKVMRQYLGIYNEALTNMRDINYLVAIDTRYLGEAAAAAQDDNLIELVFRFMNSYLRATLNARDVRTAYNVLNQYRLLVESMLREGNGDAALEGVKHMNYYGHTSFDMKLPFVTETVAYDVSALCQFAHDFGAAEERQMLEEFLELDRPLRVRSQENALLGVRKAQVKLAAYYLTKGEERKARLISEDMRDEPMDRLATIRHALESVQSKDFWEIIDRGRNFEFMPKEQQKQLSTFFSWLNVDRQNLPRRRRSDTYI